MLSGRSVDAMKARIIAISLSAMLLPSRTAAGSLHCEASPPIGKPPFRRSAARHRQPGKPGVEGDDDARDDHKRRLHPVAARAGAAARCLSRSGRRRQRRADRTAASLRSCARQCLRHRPRPGGSTRGAGISRAVRGKAASGGRHRSSGSGKISEHSGADTGKHSRTECGRLDDPWPVDRYAPDYRRDPGTASRWRPCRHRPEASRSSRRRRRAHRRGRRSAGPIASSVARTRCARVVPPLSPVISPRVLGCQCGAPIPASAGTKMTPPLSGTDSASTSVSALSAMMPSPSRSHCTAAPAVKIDPSSA